MATHSSTPAWKIPRMEEPCMLESLVLLQRVRHDWATSLSLSHIRSYNLWTEMILLLPFQFDAFYFFFLLITLSRTSSTLLIKSGQSRHPYLVLDFRRKVFSLSSLSMMFAMGCSTWLLLYWIVYGLVCWMILSWKDVEFFSLFFFINCNDNLVFSFILLM